MKAFPVEYYGREEGMDLRDYFAAKAMNNLKYLTHPKDLAREAYRIADAMMKERENNE